MTPQTHIPPSFISRVLTALKAPSSYENVRLFDAWIRCEGGNAKWNPLNSSLSLGNQWTEPVDYNSIPVRNYRYETAGVVATVLTFIQREADGSIRFGGIMGDLQQSKKTAEQIVEDRRAEFSRWGTDVDLLLRVLAETAA